MPCLFYNSSCNCQFYLSFNSTHKVTIVSTDAVIYFSFLLQVEDARIVSENIMNANGVIQVIDKVLIPDNGSNRLWRSMGLNYQLWSLKVTGSLNQIKFVIPNIAFDLQYKQNIFYFISLVTSARFYIYNESSTIKDIETFFFISSILEINWFRCFTSLILNPWNQIGDFKIYSRWYKNINK